jgi:hypothetical protein
MTDDKDIRADQHELEEDQRDDSTLTKRIAREGATEPEMTTTEASTSEQESASGGLFQQMWRRIQEQRKRPKRVELNTRGQNNLDSSKAFLVLATAVVLVGFVFLALFSTSGAEKRAQERRTKPSLGRPESTVQQAGATGSTVPLLSAEQNGGDPNGDQLSPDDILATSRRTQTPPPKQEQSDAKGPNQYTVESLGGYKVKEVADMLAVPIGRVRYWVAEKLLLTKGGRITDSSFSKFLAEHPKKIPFDNLSPPMQNWLVEAGYPSQGTEPTAAEAAQ